MISALWEIENALILRSYLIDKTDAGVLNSAAFRAFTDEAFLLGNTEHLANAVARLVDQLVPEEGVVLDSEVGPLLGTLGVDINIPIVALDVKYIFDTVSRVPPTVHPTLVTEDDTFLFAIATAVATSSILTAIATHKESDVSVLASMLLERFTVVPPKPPIFEFREEPFSPSSFTFDVDKIIRLNSEFEDHNIEALKYKSYNNSTKENNLSFADMSKSLASFVWAINRTIDIHRNDEFKYDFSRLGTEHIGRIARSWGIKDIDNLTYTVEEVMKGIGSIYESEERIYHFPVPSMESEEYAHFRYVFNIALASVASAHIFLFSSNFDSTQSAVYGEARRTIKEVQDGHVAGV